MYPHAAPMLLGAFLLTGCVDGDLTRRDDGVQAAQMRTRIESPFYQNRLQAEAARLQKENPALSRKDAFARARENVAPDDVDVTGPTRAELERKRAQDEFEDDLAALKQ